MENPEIRLRCEISNLQTQLICARQEKQKLYDTVILLSGLLSGFAQSNQSIPWDLHSPTLTDNSEDSPKARPLSRYSSADEVPNLIDLAVSPSETQHGDQIKAAEVGTVHASFNTDSTESLTDSTIEQVRKSKDRPPVLDLQFKGLRTSHDGPKKTSGAENSLKSRSLGQAPSFEEIYGRAARDNAINHEGDKKTTRIDPSVENGKKSEAISENRQPSIVHINKSNVYHIPARRSAPNHESSPSGGRAFFRLPMSLLQGIRYEPREDERQTKTRVMLFNLPKDVSLSSILSKVRGGTVISCNLLDTGFAYGSSSAMIRFSKQAEAMFCVNHAATKPLIFEGRKAVAQLIPTPSYPLTLEVHRNIFENGHTRCLRMTRFSHFKDRGVIKQYTDPRFIEFQATNEMGDWFVRFTSLQRASDLWADARYLGYCEYNGGFMPDPCAVDEPLDAGDVKENKIVQEMPMAPLNWQI